MQEPLTPIAIEAAVDSLLGNVDTFTDWLGGECLGMDKVTSDYESRNFTRLRDASTPVVLAAVLRAIDSGDTDVSNFGMILIKDRYLKAHDDRLRLLATEYSQE